MALVAAVACSTRSTAIAGDDVSGLEGTTTESVVVTSHGLSSTTSAPLCFNEVSCTYDVFVVEGGEFESLQFEILGSSAFDPQYCRLDPALAGAGFQHGYGGTTTVSRLATSLLPGARLVSCEGMDFFDNDNSGIFLDFTDLSVEGLLALDFDKISVDPPRFCVTNIHCDEDGCGHMDYRPEPACGDAIYDGRVRASDSLAALKTSVGVMSCGPFPTSCDTNGDGEVTASDALVILTVAVGRKNVPLSCPLPCNS